MPYKLQKSGDHFCVVKSDGSSVPGGCHPTHQEALSHLRALYSNVKDAAEGPWSINGGGDAYGTDIKGIGDRWHQVQMQKIDKEAVHYRHAVGGEMCGNCQNGHFISPDKQGVCLVVKGPIDYPAVCDAYVGFATVSSFVPDPVRKPIVHDVSSLDPEDLSYISWTLKARTFSQEQRDNLAKQGKALPDGSYPIENVGDLKNAIRAVGRGKGSHAKIRSHIKKRAKALGAETLIPNNWGSDGPE